MSTKLPEGVVWCRDFTPGYLDSPESDTLPPGATPDAKNGFLYRIDLRRRRAVMGRTPGSRLITPTALALGARIDMLAEWRHAGAQTLLAMCNGSLSSVDPIAQTVTPIGPGWTAGEAADLTPWRNDAFIFDGTFLRRWDGTTLHAVGSGAPNTLTNMSAVAGPGVTGTYESFYTWYDATRDHDSSPSDFTTAVVFANQTRRHTKPGSAAPTWATHWRAWVRRTDTSELNVFLAGAATIATATLDETTSDTVRQRSTVAPLPNSNDAPPGAWMVLEEHKGHGIGILPGSDSFAVSKLTDFQSWHPKDTFPTSRATGDYLTWCKSYGTEKLIGTKNQAWRLVNEQFPFKPELITGSYGNVHQQACLEVGGKFYGWDADMGPYVTDLVDWTPLGLHRIDTILESVNQLALDKIRCVYAKKYGLIGWAIPTGSSSRCRTILWYHVGLDCWLPPRTGLEWSALCSFKDSGGRRGIYAGDCWGRIFELFSGSKEGVPTESPTDNVRQASVQSATANTVTPALPVGRTLYTTGHGLAGLPVAVKSGGGVWQWRRIASNTGTVITLDTTNDAPWDTVPDDQYEVVIGGLEWYWWTPWIDYGIPHLAKKLQELYVMARSASADHHLYLQIRYNNDDGTVSNETLTFDTAQTAGVWGVGLWGQALWATTPRTMRKKKVTRSPYSVQVRFLNFYPDQDISVPMWGLSADKIQGMEVPSA